eukprot:4300250-Amphidinium_carterae.1
MSTRARCSEVVLVWTGPQIKVAAAASPICYHRSGEPRYVCLTALPFGSVSSVAHFLSTGHMGVGLFSLVGHLGRLLDFIALEFEAVSEIGGL